MIRWFWRVFAHQWSRTRCTMSACEGEHWCQAKERQSGKGQGRRVDRRQGKYTPITSYRIGVGWGIISRRARALGNGNAACGCWDWEQRESLVVGISARMGMVVSYRIVSPRFGFRCLLLLLRADYFSYVPSSIWIWTISIPHPAYLLISWRT
jgi:hypothetical protein